MTADDAAAAWSVFDQMQSERAEREREELYAAETRWLSFEWLRRKIGPAAASLTWREYEAVAPAHFTTTSHVCTPRTCSHECCPVPGRAFRDPATGVVFHASGVIYVCRTSGRRHACDDACDAAEVCSKGTVSCPISGRFSGGHIDHREGFNHHEVASLERESDSYKRATTSINTYAKRARANKAAKAAALSAAGLPPALPAAPQPGAAHANNHIHEADRVVTRLVCSGAIRAALLKRCAEEDVALGRELSHALAHGRRPNVVELVDMAASHIPAGTATALAVLGWTRPMPLNAPAYLRGCVLRLFALVRCTPVGIDGGKDINLGKMCVPLMYMLMRGLTGVVDRRRAVVERRVEHDAGDDAPPTPEGVIRYAFVPAHRCLSALLPEEPALPPMPDWTTELGNLMKRTRRLEQCFLSTLEDSAVAARDPGEYCLARYISPLQPLVLYTSADQ